MIITGKQAIKKIREHKITWIKIYTPDGKNLVAYRPLIDEVLSPAAIQNWFKSFLNDYPGLWQVELKAHKNHKDSISLKVQSEQGESLQGATPNDPLNMEQLTETITKQVRAEIKAEQEEKNRLDENRELKEKVKQLETPGGQLVNVLRQCATMYMQKQQAAKGVNLQGTKEGKTKDGEKGIEALNLLLQHASPAFILEVAMKIDQNPELLEQLKTFLSIETDVS